MPFLLGAGIRAIDVWRPVDGRLRDSWRECDMASVARNFYREGIDLFYPKIDWRGDGPGYAEMEFPIFPGTIAILYNVFGFHEVFGRLISYFFSLLTILVFFRLSRYVLPELGARAASLFFVLSPLLIRISNSLQPEALMFFFYLLACYAFIRWIEEDSWKFYIVAVMATALAILFKASAIHVGVFFAILILKQKGFKALRSVWIWIFAIVSLLPAFLWYFHSHNLWLTYGNSLGVSNQYHWAGWDLFTNPNYMLGIGRLEFFFVWMPTGLIIALIGILFRRKEKTIQYSLYWFSAVVIFYLVAARTTSISYAHYYHIFSIPAAALLIGMGVVVLGGIIPHQRFLDFLVIIFGILVICIIGISFGGVSQLSRLNKLGIWLGLSGILSIIPFLKWKNWHWSYLFKNQPKILNVLVICFLFFCVPGTYLYQTIRIAGDIHPKFFQGLYRCAKDFSPYIPDNVLIVCSGASCYIDGYSNAYNASYMFYWLDRKGFNICEEEQSVETLEAFAERGARYFIAEKRKLQLKPGLQLELKNRFNLLAECEEAFLFDITHTK